MIKISWCGISKCDLDQISRFRSWVWQFWSDSGITSEATKMCFSCVLFLPRDEFSRKLTLLSNQWQGVIRRAQQRRGIIDSQIRQWQRYKEMAEKLRKWLAEVSSLPLSGLGDVPIPLQHARTLFDEVQVRCQTLNSIQATVHLAFTLGLYTWSSEDSGMMLHGGQTLFSNANGTKKIEIVSICSSEYSGSIPSQPPHVEDSPALWSPVGIGKTPARKRKLGIGYM